MFTVCRAVPSFHYKQVLIMGIRILVRMLEMNSAESFTIFTVSNTGLLVLFCFIPGKVKNSISKMQRVTRKTAKTISRIGRRRKIQFSYLNYILF